MDFELSDDQVALQEAVRSFCGNRFTSEATHEMAETGVPTREVWQELAEMGVFGLCVPEADGGAGLGWVEAMVVFEELGRCFAPGPLIATFLAAQFLPEVVSGAKVVTMLDGSSRPVMLEHPSFADVLAVIDSDSVKVVSLEGMGGGELGGVGGSAREGTGGEMPGDKVPLDALTPVVKLSDEEFQELQAGAKTLEGANPETWRLQAAALIAAQQLGLAAGATAQAVGFATERKQFDKPIGQFQAVKHLCSDMLTAVEVARAAVYFAGALLDDPEYGDAQRAVSTARIVASEAANICGRNCVQIHGGMGYTWEMDAHFFLKRAWVLDATLAPPEAHAESLASVL